MAKSKYIETLEEQYTKKDAKSVLRYKAPDNKWRYIQSSKTPDGGNPMPSGGGMVEVTWQELKDKRDNGELTAGSLYRITDYNCTTTQENTRSAGHQFDIVLLALSENKLAEEGWAMMNESNVYDVIFDDGVTKKCYIYCASIEDDFWNVVEVDTMLGWDEVQEIEINEDTKTAIVRVEYGEGGYAENLPYSYFQNSNLSAWKVWYCLDNDTTRFAWADDSFTCSVSTPIGDFDDWQLIRDTSQDSNGLYGYKLYHQGNNASTTINFLSHSKIVGSGTYTVDVLGYTNVPIDVEILDSIGKGVIYRLIDEFNNDIKYDFKNIQFKRKLTDGQYDVTNGTDTWCYTLNLWYDGMCQDASIVGNTLPNDEGYVVGVYDNKFGYATAHNICIEGVNTFAFALGDNVVLSVFEDDYYGIYSNTIGNAFYKNTIGSGFYENTIGNIFESNTIANNFQSNTIKDAFLRNVIEDDFRGNMIGLNFMDNTIRNMFRSNMVGNYFNRKTISDNTVYKNYGNNGVELATKS